MKQGVHPGNQPDPMQSVFTDLQPYLARRRQARVLVQVPREQVAGLVFRCIDWYLHFSTSKQIVLIVRPDEKTKLLHFWRTTPSAYGERRLSSRYTIADSPHLRRAQQVNVSLFSLREMQLLLRQAAYPVKTFDLILFSAVPAQLSAPWKQVMRSLSTARLIGMCQHVTEETSACFAGNVIRSVQMDDAHPSST